MRKLNLHLLLLCLTTAPLLSSAPARAQDDALPDLSGRWAQLLTTTSLTDLPVLGSITTRTTSLLLLEVDQDGERLDISQSVCDIKLSSDIKRVRTVVPRGFMRAASQRRAGRVWRDGTTVRYELPPNIVVLGAKLENTERDRLPTDHADSRVRDADADGKPGLTIRVEGLLDGELYVVQRGWNHLTGEVFGDHIDGHVRWASEQSVIESTSVLLGDSPTSRSTGARSQNFFKSRRVRADTTCSALRKQARSLFP